MTAVVQALVRGWIEADAAVDAAQAPKPEALTARKRPPVAVPVETQWRRGVGGADRSSGRIGSRGVWLAGCTCSAQRFAA
jgi:hypothetical protein